ncbi:DUF2809 domain-containing protein [Patescibacteria group bacterium]
MNKKYLKYSLILLIIGLAIFFTNGFGYPIIRNYLGDIVAVFFIYALVSIFCKAKLSVRCTFVFLTALLIELTQIFLSNSSGLQDLILGNTFDFFDLLAYLIAIGLIFLFEK